MRTNFSFYNLVGFIAFYSANILHYKPGQICSGLRVKRCGCLMCSCHCKS